MFKEGKKRSLTFDKGFPRDWEIEYPGNKLIPKVKVTRAAPEVASSNLDLNTVLLISIGTNLIVSAILNLVSR